MVISGAAPLIVSAFRRVRRSTSTDAFQTCDAGRARVQLPSEAVHRTSPSDVLTRIKRDIRYSKALNFQQPAIENWKLGPLPQTYADQFGWEEMVGTVARVYNGLAADLRAKTAIFAQNYGQAGGD
jgi:hypothetical protein